MSFKKATTRFFVAALCIVGHLLAVSQVSLAVLLAPLHGGHVAVLVEHGGHQDVMLHHDLDDDEAASELPHAERHAGHEDHHDHVLCLNVGPDVIAWAKTSPVPTPASHISMLPVTEIVCKGHQVNVLATLPRPPPRAVDGVLLCLRTTVLIV
jgi:hypothetical protein